MEQNAVKIDPKLKKIIIIAASVILALGVLATVFALVIWPMVIYPLLPAYKHYDPQISASLTRADTITLTTIPSKLQFAHTEGQGVIIDLTSKDAEINSTLEISGDVTAVKLVGRQGVTYKGLNIVVSSHDSYPLLIELENFSMQGSDVDGAIRSDSERSIYIKSSGISNEILGADSSPAVNVKSDLYILGDAPLKIAGGNGSDGVSAESLGVSGTAGSPGGTALIAKNLCIFIGSTIDLIGGNGGNGGDGKEGSNGYPSYYGHSDRNALFDGEDGGNGQAGGSGGDGGRGGFAYDVETIYLGSGVVYAVGGDSGNGGNGKRGGNGGKGQESGGWGTTAGDGGDGGNGGRGGNSYLIGASDGEEKTTIKDGNLNRTDGLAGTPGTAGSGGYAGAKGMHCDNDNCGQWLTAGNDGRDGRDGSDGIPGEVIEIK